jgi:hypothetical protein
VNTVVVRTNVALFVGCGERCPMTRLAGGELALNFRDLSVRNCLFSLPRDFRRNGPLTGSILLDQPRDSL